jgi:hypothetical protein
VVTETGEEDGGGETVELDTDGDGLGDSIDPEPETFSAWGIINPVMGRPVCLVELDGFTYTYIAGTAVTRTLGTGPSLPGKTGSGKPGAGGTAPFGISGFLGRTLTIVQVDGMTDRSQATLDRIACGGISTPEDFEYGIYIISEDDAPADAKVGIGDFKAGPAVLEGILTDHNVLK